MCASKKPRGDKRALILDAAREVFGELGFGGTKISDIAKRAGIAYGTVYGYFAGKDELFFTLADQLFADMTRLDLPAGSPADGPADLVRRTNRAYCRAYERNAAMMAAVEEAAAVHPGFRERRRRHRAGFIGLVAAGIKDWQSTGIVYADLDPELTARSLSAMIDQSLYQWFVQGEDAAGLDHLLDTLDKLTLRALGLEP